MHVKAETRNASAFEKKKKEAMLFDVYYDSTSSTFLFKKREKDPYFRKEFEMLWSASLFPGTFRPSQ